ncbi:MAG: 2Fe-2S iron-sulfur cluster-binding protein [Pusillimonas sp.]
MRITVIDEGGAAHELAVQEGESVMQAIRDAGVDIAAQCGGCCSCATCHVYVDETWMNRLPPPSEDESAMLELAMEWRPESRLSCQVNASPALDGLVVRLAPGSSL